MSEKMITKGQMNVVLGVMGVFTLLFIIGAAGSSHSPNTTPKEQVTDYYTFTTQLNSALQTTGGYYSVAPEGRVYVVVTLHMKNTGTKTYSTLPSYWVLKTEAGGEYQVDPLTYSAKIQSKVIAVPPGTDVTTQMIYNIPKGSGELRLKYTGTDHE